MVLHGRVERIVLYLNYSASAITTATTSEEGQARQKKTMKVSAVSIKTLWVSFLRCRLLVGEENR